ncbi:secreted antigen 1 [Babesia caballi]|uniref:Secreted antigen 1 n=1 Tax=Babesia caballi TaxID=5871 RepID=A0AAV4LNX4_BABCB|nr:secreted antigen 1 [Babesia caballi]
MGNAGSYPEPTTVKDILDFVALLYRDQEVYNKVCNILKEEIQVICRSTSNDFLSTFQTVMTQLKKLKYAITVGTDLGKYNDVKLYVDYVDQYAGTLIISLPMLYSATCYLACHLHKGCSSDEKGWVKHTFARNTEKTCYASCGDNVARSWLSDKSSFNNQFIRGGFSGKSIVPTSDKYLELLESMHSGLTTRTLGLLGDVYETPFAYGFCFRAKLNYKPNMSVSESIVGFPINDTSSLHQLAYQMSTPFKDLLWGSLYCLIVIGVILCTAYIIIKT